jgi:hypothetical protein
MRGVNRANGFISGDFKGIAKLKGFPHFHLQQCAVGIKVSGKNPGSILFVQIEK